MFEVKFSTGNSAFRSDYEEDKNGEFILDPSNTEIHRILDKIKYQLKNGEDCGSIIDINGNKVGSWKLD